MRASKRWSITTRAAPGGTWSRPSKETLKDVEVYAGDITDPWSVRTAVKGSDTVFHLAALIGIPLLLSCAPKLRFHQHQRHLERSSGRARLRRRERKAVHTSTSETYGTALYTPIDERNIRFRASPPIRRAKSEPIRSPKVFISHFKFRSPPSVRSVLYGPRQSARAVIPTVISQILSGSKNIRLGSLSPVRHFTYVQDTVSGFLAVGISEKSIGQVTNIGSGKGITIGDTVSKIIRLIGNARSPSRLADQKRVRPEHSEVMELLCNFEKAKSLLGWEPKFSFEDGLKETIALFEKNIGLYKSDIYNV